MGQGGVEPLIPSDVRLYTWLDAEEVLFRWLEETLPPPWFVDARAYWDGITIRVRGGYASETEAWLKSLFDPRISEARADLFARLDIALESADGKPRTLPVSIEETEEVTPKLRINLSFGRPALVQSGAFAALSPPPLPENGPTIFAFHSFKGGVGRTVHALALALAFAEDKRPVLLIDGDLEAPGISWLIEGRLPNPPVSFADLLALAHGDPDDSAQASVELTCTRLRDAELDGIYVLPAFRSFRTTARARPRLSNIHQA